jgi:hypothetical protein
LAPWEETEAIMARLRTQMGNMVGAVILVMAALLGVAWLISVVLY